MLPTILEGLIVLFWFCAAVALAAELGVHSCSNRVSLANTSLRPHLEPSRQERPALFPFRARSPARVSYGELLNHR